VLRRNVEVLKRTLLSGLKPLMAAHPAVTLIHLAFQIFEDSVFRFNSRTFVTGVSLALVRVVLRVKMVLI